MNLGSKWLSKLEKVLVDQNLFTLDEGLHTAGD